MKVYCSCCAKQITNAHVLRENKEMTVAQGAKAGFANQKICGYCADELDENGLYPEYQHQRMENEIWDKQNNVVAVRSV